MKQLLKILTISLLLSLFLFSAPGVADDDGDSIEVEVNTGPQFYEYDNYEIEYCTKDVYWNFFPMDFLFNGSTSLSSSQCPNIEFFGHQHEMCWVLDIYTDVVSPAFILSTMIYAVFHL